ncbi:MAG: hypothetical protein IKO86_10130 [Prevotella sp.]|nr:hypothetical protein [Prevotella sp.]
MNKFIGCLVLSALTTMPVFAQSGTNSPYSQYGLGDLADEGVGFNKGMGGVGYAFRKGNEVNPMNPASYASIDSVTMIFDGGLSGQITNFKEGGRKLNAKSGGFDYVTGAFRLFRHVGVTFGVMSYSNIGYSYSSSERPEGMTTDMVYKYSGDGGLNQLFVGMGFQILKSLSVGFNVGYLWGDMERTVKTSTSSSINTLYREYNASISNYKLDFGLQYTQPVSAKDNLTLGAVFSPGHKLNADPYCREINANSSILKSDTTTYTITNGLELPTTIGVGLAINHDQRLRVGADFRYQKWGSIDFPAFSGNSYSLRSGLLKDSYKFNVGAEWIPNPRSTRSVFHHIRYRLGAGYTTPYYYINGQDGPKDLQLSLGIGVPIMNAYNNRSFLNVSAQWQHRSADNLITENTFRLNIGITFNERWFSKMKVE